MVVDKKWKEIFLYKKYKSGRFPFWTARLAPFSYKYIYSVPLRPTKRAQKVYHAQFSPIHHVLADMLTQLPKWLSLRSKKILGICERCTMS
jgi:hypothetical protein